MTHDASDGGAQAPVTLGEVEINNHTFELDLKINEGYQAYSAELLRLSLLAITGISLLWLKLFFPDHPEASRAVGSSSSTLEMAFGCFVLSATAALLHRNTAAESLAYHLTALRRYKRRRPARDSRPGDLELAAKDQAKRNWYFRISGFLLWASAVLLMLGVMLLGVALHYVMAGSNR